MSFRVVVATGNGQGLVGVGIGKSGLVREAVRKGVVNAQKNLIEIPITQDGTVPESLTSKYRGSRVRMSPAKQKAGIYGSAAAKAICDVAGIRACHTR